MLRQQMETAAEDRQEAREREERLTGRLLTLATPAIQDRQIRSAYQGETEPGTHTEGGDSGSGPRTTAGCMPSAASAPLLVPGASLREVLVWMKQM